MQKTGSMQTITSIPTGDLQNPFIEIMGKKYFRFYQARRYLSGALRRDFYRTSPDAPDRTENTFYQIMAVVNLVHFLSLF